MHQTKLSYNHETALVSLKVWRQHRLFINCHQLHAGCMVVPTPVTVNVTANVDFSLKRLTEYSTKEEVVKVVLIGRAEFHFSMLYKV
jgi:hypothetical protein